MVPVAAWQSPPKPHGDSPRAYRMSVPCGCPHHRSPVPLSEFAGGPMCHALISACAAVLHHRPPSEGRGGGGGGGRSVAGTPPDRRSTGPTECPPSTACARPHCVIAVPSPALLGPSRAARSAATAPPPPIPHPCPAICGACAAERRAVTRRGLRAKCVGALGQGRASPLPPPPLPPRGVCSQTVWFAFVWFHHEPPLPPRRRGGCGSSDGHSGAEAAGKCRCMWAPDVGGPVPRHVPRPCGVACRRPGGSGVACARGSPGDMAAQHRVGHGARDV